MWQAVRRVAAKTGGHQHRKHGRQRWVLPGRSAADYIFADPSAIVGSIGVVGGKFVTKDLYDKLGITTQKFSAAGTTRGCLGLMLPFLPITSERWSKAG